ncbi:hypothetical protein [Mucilaginibacter ginsenosidivorans]|uniref:Uncharacterized protein n=1 Tax=Mucilaginibacter ginsenosidivorans TaxID=398053 RepID=A0A5B8UXJ6_9SPHI|nr:hypothetical protein [Mucilaginibacter ginsenosidivorans]QEC63395.1 hypothetical protein FRZ54_12690 [Mucilaginibacter ginsenosidivorans]
MPKLLMMKSLYFLLAIIICIFLNPSCNQKTAITKKGDEKSKCKLIIFELMYGSSGNGFTNTKQTPQISAAVLLVNNSDDTLKFTYLPCNLSKIYQVDSKNLKLRDTGFACVNERVWKIVISPHSYFDFIVNLAYRKIPDTTFTFRLGLSLLPWKSVYTNSPPDDKTIAGADTIWSGTQQFNADENKEIGQKIPEEYKKELQIIYPPLTAYQQKGYVLNVITGKMAGPRDTSDRCHKKCKYLSVPIKLENNTNDTLQYKDMTCDWQLIYQTDNSNISILTVCGCDANFDDSYRIAPGKDSLFYIPVYYDKKIVKPGTRFRIGMTLLKTKRGLIFENFPGSVELLRDNPQYNIWTNEVTIP